MRVFAALALCCLMSTGVAHAQSLRGSPASLDLQNRMAKQHDLSSLRTASEVSRFVDMGLLVPLRGNGDYELASVSFAYARPEVKLFVERLARQYRAACGEALVVTSLTRPHSHQPRNASSRSVHPTGMAIDLRVSQRASCRQWLERTLLSLEGSGVLDATRERYPPHYHVAVFPRPYRRYVDRLLERDAPRLASATHVLPSGERGDAASAYRVSQGDTLWGIARRTGVTVEEIKELNGLRSPRIYAGQVLSIPTR